MSNLLAPNPPYKTSRRLRTLQESIISRLPTSTRVSSRGHSHRLATVVSL